MFDVNFDFFEPFDTDFHAIKGFLQKAYNWCKINPVLDLSEVCAAICDQGNVGTVLKTEEGEDEDDNADDNKAGLLGVCTLLNLKQYSKEFATSLPAFLKWLSKVMKNSGASSSSSSSSSANNNS